MKYKLICCDVLEMEASLCIKKSDAVIDVEYTEKAAHEKPHDLRDRIQAAIDRATGYDAVLLGFGLCGNSLDGLKAGDSPVVAPRAHDCCTIFLGSRQRFNQLFSGRESMSWGCTGYCRKDGDYLRKSDTGKQMGLDRTYDEFVDEYGEENARFIWETIHPQNDADEVLFINIPETYDPAVYMDFEREMGMAGKKINIEKGSMELIMKMTDGKWDDDFIVIPPGNGIAAVYDKEEILRKKDL
ncbi:MAG: DUF1638 domain-containing protein [Clostridia bacterium]